MAAWAKARLIRVQGLETDAPTFDFTTFDSVMDSIVGSGQKLWFELMGTVYEFLRFDAALDRGLFGANRDAAGGPSDSRRWSDLQSPDRMAGVVGSPGSRVLLGGFPCWA